MVNMTRCCVRGAGRFFFVLSSLLVYDNLIQTELSFKVVVGYAILVAAISAMFEFFKEWERELDEDEKFIYNFERSLKNEKRTACFVRQNEWRHRLKEVLDYFIL